MRQYMYVKVSAETAVQYGFDTYRRQTFDGGYIINEGDLFSIGGENDTIEQKVSMIGGTLMTALEAKVEFEKTNDNE